MSDENFRTEAIAWAESTEEHSCIAKTYALVYIGDQIRDLVAALPTLAMLHTPLEQLPDESEPAPSDGESPAIEEAARENGYYLPGGRPYRPATNPEDWRLDASTGEYISPAGRRYNPTSQHAIGMLRKLQRRGVGIKLYDEAERDESGRLLASARAQS